MKVSLMDFIIVLCCLLLIIASIIQFGLGGGVTLAVAMVLAFLLGVSLSDQN